MFYESTRYRWAFRFGRWEHFLSRMLFVCLLLTLIAHANAYYTITLNLIYADIILWLGYWCSHRLEKWAHPNH